MAASGLGSALTGMGWLLRPRRLTLIGVTDHRGHHRAGAPGHLQVPGGVDQHVLAPSPLGVAQADLDLHRQ